MYLARLRASERKNSGSSPLRKTTTGAPLTTRRQPTHSSKPVKPCRIVDQNLFAGRRIRRPYRKLIEQTAIVDLKQRLHVGRFSAGRRYRIRMRPIGAPDNAVGIRRDQRAGKRDHVGVVRPEFRRPIGTRNLYVTLARPHQLREVGKARLLRTELALRTAEMIEHNGDRRGGDE